MTRYCRMIRVRPEFRDEYIRLHTSPRDEVQQVMKDNGIRSHAIFIKDDLLVSVFEYVGDSYETDMQNIAEHPVTRTWWEKTAPMQEPLENREEGEWWTFLDPLTSYE